MSRNMNLVLGTTNDGKAAEFRDLLSETPWRLRYLADFAELPDVLEDGASLSENARQKAVQLARGLQQWVLADDTGLEVDALDGEPGVRSARYAGPAANAAANRERLLAELAGVPAQLRTARFRCVLVLADPSGSVRAEANGVCNGRIRQQPQGRGGFGYDVLFEVVEYHRTLAELSPAATSCLSHRARAVRSLMPMLVRLGLG